MKRLTHLTDGERKEALEELIEHESRSIALSVCSEILESLVYKKNKIPTKDEGTAQKMIDVVIDYMSRKRLKIKSKDNNDIKDAHSLKDDNFRECVEHISKQIDLEHSREDSSKSVRINNKYCNERVVKAFEEKGYSVWELKLHEVFVFSWKEI